MSENRGQVFCRLWTVHENVPLKKEGEFCSLHPDMRSFETFFDVHLKKRPSQTPEIYMMPTHPADMSGKPVSYMCMVDMETYDRIMKSGLGAWSATVPRNEADSVTTIPAEDLTTLEEEYASA